MIARYKINKFKLNSIYISIDAKAKDLVDAVSKKHNKKFAAVYSNQFKEILGYNDPLRECSSEYSIYYISETDQINPDDFINKSNSHQFSYTDDFVKGEKIFKDYTSEIYEVVHKNTNSKYYADIPIKNQSLEYVSLLPSVIHGAVSIYKGFCTEQSSKTVLLSKFYTNGLLSKLIETQEDDQFFDSTKRMIIIYGIASGMSYLNSIGIQNFRLSSNNILLNSYLFPKISFFGFPFNEDNSYDYSRGSMRSRNYSKANLDKYLVSKTQVLLFSLVVYEILFEEPAFEYINNRTIRTFKNGERPKIYPIGLRYKGLIEDCWRTNPDDRPSFDEIVTRLKSDPEIFLDGADKEIYYEYIKLIDEYSDFIDEAKEKIISFEEYVNKKSDKFKKYKLNENKEEEEDNNDNEDATNSLNIEYINLNNYSKVKFIGEGSYGQVYKVQSKDQKDFYSAKISINKISKAEEKETNIYKEALIISRLNHPSILKFIGYSPKNFENENKPVILTEFLSNGSLGQIFELNRHRVRIDGWNCTKKLINIYGIASCMSYLHSLNIIHRDLKITNILLDSYFYPKLANFCFSTLPEDYSEIMNQKNKEIIGNPINYAPEVFEREEYSKASDVYSFSYIVFEVVIGKRPFYYETIYQVMEDVIKGKRLEIDQTISDCYINLINKCWSQEPSKRPSFLEIVEELRTNEDFINDDEVDKNEYLAYIKYIDEYMKSIKNVSIEDFFNKEKIELIKVDLAAIRKKHSDELKTKIPIKYANLNEFSLQNKIGEGSFSFVYKVLDKKTSRIYSGKISKFEIDQFNEELLISHYREIEILSKLNHPCILYLIGYSPINFEHEEYPMIITEFASGGTLSNVINLERFSLSPDNWNNTTKLINIYGISLGMMYLHDLDIIHRDLKPDNILLDNFLYPKLADFGLSKIITKEKSGTPATNYGLKGTLTYCAPEILSNYCYSKAGDVYAFGLVVYEIVTNEVPYKDINNLFSLLNAVVIEKKRPSFNYPIDHCYQELIEGCWQQDPLKRPTFEEIINNLKENPDFLSSDIDEQVFIDYILNIEESISRKMRKKGKKLISEKKVEEKTDQKDMQNLIKTSNKEKKLKRIEET